MNLRDPVHLVAADEGEMGHTDMFRRAPSAHDRHPRHPASSPGLAALTASGSAIDLEDDLQVARQQAASNVTGHVSSASGSSVCTV